MTIFSAVAVICVAVLFCVIFGTINTRMKYKHDEEMKRLDNEVEIKIKREFSSEDKNNTSDTMSKVGEKTNDAD